MNNEYNKQNNGGQNRQFNNNIEKDVKPQAQPETTTCTCCEETKKGILDQAKDFATKNKTGLRIGAAVAVGTGLLIWAEKKFGLIKKTVDKIRGKKAEAPAEAPAEEQK